MLGEHPLHDLVGLSTRKEQTGLRGSHLCWAAFSHNACRVRLSTVRYSQVIDLFWSISDNEGLSA